MTGIIGILAAIFPNVWSGPSPYLRPRGACGQRAISADCRAVLPRFLGAAMMLYFSQGAGRMIWPVSGGAIRMIIAGAVIAILVKLGV